MAERGPWKQLTPGEVFAGKFRLEREIAAGGMGSVWRAWNTQLEIPVAIKVISGTVAEWPGVVERFEREARAAAQIGGPNVVQIYEHGVHEGLPYMVMELLVGEDLLHRLKRVRRLPLPHAARVVRDIAKALHRAHELGIVHRDLKPANIFLVGEGDDETAKVLDFGVAKLTQTGDSGLVTATGEIMGTPNFMSPEHIQTSKYVDHRADLWSLAVITFRAVTGHLPYSGQVFEVTRRILSGPPPVPSDFAPDLPPAVDTFFARAMARDIRQRFQSARELSDAFGKLVGEVAAASVSGPAGGGAPADELPTIALPRPSVTSAPGISEGADDPLPTNLFRRPAWVGRAIVVSVLALLAMALWAAMRVD